MKPERVVELMQEYSKNGNPRPALEHYNSKNRKKLLEAAKFLRELKLPKDSKFDLMHFGLHEPKNKDDHTPPEKNYCGTTACALGWMAIKNKFGLEAEWQKITESKWDIKTEEYYQVYTGEHSMTVKHKITGNCDFDAATETFDFYDSSVADWLFMTDTYKKGSKTTKEEVAERLEFVEATNLAYPRD
jgi:hypothetical protein